MSRLTSAVLVGALLRRAQAEGGFGAVLAKGDASAGAITLLLAERGRKVAVFERLLQPDGHYAWAAAHREVADEAALDGFLARRRAADPDLWIVELDVASAERFAAEMNA